MSNENEELRKWIEFGSDETDNICPCCNQPLPVKDEGDGCVIQYYDDLVGCM